MNMTWDLDIMYKGYDDPKYLNDLEKLKNVIASLNEFWEEKMVDDSIQVIEKELQLEENLQALVLELYTYSSLKASCDVNDLKAVEEITKLNIMLQGTVAPAVAFKKYLKNVDLISLKEKSKMIETYMFYLSNLKEEANHMLSDKEEVLESKLRLVGSNAWSDLQSQLTSNLMIKVDGQGVMPLSAVRNLAYSDLKEVRYNAYKAELASYKQIEASVASALNNIKREVNIMMELRGYDNALEKTLKQSNMSKATLDAMIGAIKEELPRLREYFKIKAEALGHKNGLPFYELFAPMGHLTKTYTFDEAKKAVLDVYKSFSEPLYEMGKRAFDNRWIDVLPREGKVGGAFCAGLDNHVESRVLTNFTGSLGDVQTLAHELGHAYHGQVIQENAPLNRAYPMPLAETASILCQTLMAKKMFNDISSDEMKLTIIEQSLEEDTQCIVDILSRFLFEEKVLSTPIEKPLSSDDLCKMMTDAQKESYGDALDYNFGHPYMWICKSHYYSADLNYYNWPYAFGELYGKGLYKEYLKDKKAFVENYDQMLKNTGMMSVEDVTKTMGIDVTKKEFWLEALKSVEEDIEIFKELILKCNK